MQKIANQLSNVFSDSRRVTKSHISGKNISVKIEIPERQITSVNDSKVHLKRGRPIDSKDKNFWKKKGLSNDNNIE